MTMSQSARYYRKCDAVRAGRAVAARQGIRYHVVRMAAGYWLLGFDHV